MCTYGYILATKEDSFSSKIGLGLNESLKTFCTNVYVMLSNIANVSLNLTKDEQIRQSGSLDVVISYQVSARMFRIMVFFSLIDNKHTFLFVSTTFCVPVGSCILYPGVSGYRECVVFNTTFHELVAGAITL